MDGRQLSLLNQFNRIHNLYAAVKRSLLVEVDGDVLHPAEMHVLVRIVSHPGLTPGDAAEALGITRSAASQLIKKLHAKGFVAKRRLKENERTVFLDPTDKGMRAVEEFFGRESSIFGAFISDMSAWSERDLNAVSRFLDALEDMLNRKLR